MSLLKCQKHGDHSERLLHRELKVVGKHASAAFHTSSLRTGSMFEGENHSALSIWFEIPIRYPSGDFEWTIIHMGSGIQHRHNHPFNTLFLYVSHPFPWLSIPPESIMGM